MLNERAETNRKKDWINMQKKRLLALILLVMLTVCQSAAAQTLPGIECFSPGLARVSALEAERVPVTAEADVKIDNAMYARDLSVLASMLSGTTIRYEGAEDTERLLILREEGEVASFALGDTETGAVLEIGGQSYALENRQTAVQALCGVPLPGYAGAESMLEELRGVPVLERVPLASVCAFIEGLKAGDALAAGFAVVQPFEVKRTMSDDGTRLTRIDISGQIARGDEAPYTVTGFLRQPAGRAPKDTFELTVTQDEKNFFELSYSALRENEIASKNKRGTASVRTALKAVGKVNGSRITSRLSVTMKNEWTADGEELKEKITVSATLEHQDGRPGMRMLRLNTVNGKLRNQFSLTTHESGDDAIALHDKVTLEVTMDENLFIAGSADVQMQIGGEKPERAIAPAAEPADAGMIAEAVEAEIRSMAAKLYPHLSESAKEKVSSGL